MGQVQFVARPGGGHIEEAALLLEGVQGIEGTGSGEQSVAEHDDEHRLEFESLGLVHGGEPEPFLVVAAGPSGAFLGLQVGLQGELRQEVGAAAELRGVVGELFQVLEAVAGVFRRSP